jgi:hypothetical protein
MRVIAFASVVAMAELVATRSFAQEDGCGASDIDFPMESTRLALEAQAELNRIASWLLEEDGRYVLVSPNEGPLPADTRLAQVRASVVARHLEAQGVWPAAIIIAAPQVVGPSRRQSLHPKARVAVTTCSGVPPAIDAP